VFSTNVGESVYAVKSFLVASGELAAVCWRSVYSMDILITHTTLARRGGAETYLLNLVDGFCAAGNRVHLVVGKSGGVQSLPKGCTVESVRAGWVPQKLRPWYLDRQFRRRLAARPGFASFSLARNSGHDVITNAGTHCGFIRAMQRQPSWSDRVQIAVEKKAYREARRVVAWARLIADELRGDYGVDEEKMSVIYPPIDRIRFNTRLRTRQAEFRAHWKLPANKKLILFPSTGHERKGLPLVVDAMRRLPVDRYALVVAGRAAPEMSNGVDVISTGFVDAMEHVYAACDLTVMPSLYEPFGLVYVESALCGTPVIFGESAGAAEVLPPDWGSCLQNRSPEVLAEMIRARCESSASPSIVAVPASTMAEHVEALTRVLCEARQGQRCYSRFLPLK